MIGPPVHSTFPYSSVKEMAVCVSDPSVLEVPLDIFLLHPQKRFHEGPDGFMKVQMEPDIMESSTHLREVCAKSDILVQLLHKQKHSNCQRYPMVLKLSQKVFAGKGSNTVPRSVSLMRT